MSSEVRRGSCVCAIVLVVGVDVQVETTGMADPVSIVRTEVVGGASESSENRFYLSFVLARDVL